MNLFQNTFKKMDQALFKLIDGMNAVGVWQQLVDRFRMLSEGQQKWLNHLLSIAAIIAPLIVFFALFINQQNIRANVEVKEQLLASINTLGQIKGDYLNLERTKISRSVLESQSEAETILKRLFELKNINWEKLSLSQFKRDENGQGLIVSNFRLSFRNFTTTDLSNSLALLVEREKAVITTISIRKDTKENTLEGSLDVTHYSKGVN